MPLHLWISPQLCKKNMQIYKLSDGVFPNPISFNIFCVYPEHLGKTNIAEAIALENMRYLYLDS